MAAARRSRLGSLGLLTFVGLCFYSPPLAFAFAGTVFFGMVAYAYFSQGPYGPSGGTSGSYDDDYDTSYVSAARTPTYGFYGNNLGMRRSMAASVSQASAFATRGQSADVHVTVDSKIPFSASGLGSAMRAQSSPSTVTHRQIPSTETPDGYYGTQSHSATFASAHHSYGGHDVPTHVAHHHFGFSHQ